MVSMTTILPHHKRKRNDSAYDHIGISWVTSQQHRDNMISSPFLTNIKPPFKIYLVGGYVRDNLLGIESNDIDLACEAPSYKDMLDWVEQSHKKVFLSSEKYLTVRALGHDSFIYDYVLCRKDASYSDGRRPDSVESGTIYEDLARRDFTIGAMGYDLETGDLLDPHGGQEDIKAMKLRCVGSAEKRFKEDALRIVRAIRFSTKFMPDGEIKAVLRDGKWASSLESISRDRMREEIAKSFKADTPGTIVVLGNLVHPQIVEAIFREDIWLLATVKKR